MLRLIIQNSTHSGEQLYLDPKKTNWVLLGRGEESVLRFAEPCVSARHAIVSTEQGEFFLLDQDSTNGTFLNGERVRTSKLKTGDVIELGSFGPRLQVVIDEAKGSNDVQGADLGTRPQFDDTARVRSAQTVQWTIREAAQTIGLYNPHQDSGEIPPPIGITALALFCAIIGIIVLALTVLNLGVSVSILAGIIAFIPAAFYLGVFLWLDRYDPEPVRTLAFAFAWGAVVAIFVSSVFNEAFKHAFGDFLTGVISAPMIEEGSKGAGVVLIALLFKHDFDSVLDGIVYAGVVALGFATMENVDYYGDSLMNGGTNSLVGTFIVRGILSPFSHVLFTSMTGIGCGIARETYNPVLKFAAPLLGYAGAMTLHALWNVLASFSLGVFYFGYLFLEMPLFIGFVCVIVMMLRREARILRHTLSQEVERGLIAPEQLEIAISVFRRSRWVLSAFGDTKRFNARRQYLRSVAKLGLCHWHNSRAVAAKGQTGSLSVIPKLQVEVFNLRDQIE
ncbi:MAG: PrsW family intramembrane metalloprotease [Acidobacteria bacterium]|nr:PrsW family intramembrane metalloprotease [Acidobacteriota bacterium]